MSTSLVLFLVVAATLIGAIVLQRRRDRLAAGGYIYVNEDGSARELTSDEVEYLNTPFHGADGARPYIKSRYSELTPDGQIKGFMLRGRLPRHMKVKPN